MKLILFVDYDNLREPQKTTGILAVVTKALIQLSSQLSIGRGSCEVRIYGGWYEGPSITPLAESVVAELQGDFPTVIRVPCSTGDHPTAIQVSAELAVALLEDPSFHLFNTYRKKGRPSNLRVQQPTTVGCENPSCVLPLAKKLLKTGSCPISSCSIEADDLVYRHEQKIVDTMLSCDLVYASRMGYDCLLLISGDDDFLPPLRTVLLRGHSVFRFHTRPNGPRASFVTSSSRLVEMDL